MLVLRRLRVHGPDPCEYVVVGISFRLPFDPSGFVFERRLLLSGLEFLRERRLLDRGGVGLGSLERRRRLRHLGLSARVGRPRLVFLLRFDKRLQRLEPNSRLGEVGIGADRFLFRTWFPLRPRVLRLRQRRRSGARLGEWVAGFELFLGLL